MTKDITDCFMQLNNKSIKMFVRDIQVEDSSDELNYKETWTVKLEDENRIRHTIKVDIPKFIENQFLWLGGRLSGRRRTRDFLSFDQAAGEIKSAFFLDRLWSDRIVEGIVSKVDTEKHETNGGASGHASKNRGTAAGTEDGISSPAKCRTKSAWFSWLEQYGDDEEHANNRKYDVNKRYHKAKTAEKGKSKSKSRDAR